MSESMAKQIQEMIVEHRLSDCTSDDCFCRKMEIYLAGYFSMSAEIEQQKKDDAAFDEKISRIVNQYAQEKPF